MNQFLFHLSNSESVPRLCSVAAPDLFCSLAAVHKLVLNWVNTTPVTLVQIKVENRPFYLLARSAQLDMKHLHQTGLLEEHIAL